VKIAELDAATCAVIVGAAFVARWLVRFVIWRVQVARLALRRQADEDAIVAALRGDAEPPEGFKVAP